MSDPCCPQTPEPVWTSVDYYMEVANLPIVFVARLPALQRAWGPEFTPVAAQAAWRRAASTLAQMGLIRGSTFQFVRLGIPWSVAETAAYVGVTTSEVNAWEAETTLLPTPAWVLMASYIDRLDTRNAYTMGALAPSDYRPRIIRVYPDIPQTSSATSTTDLCEDVLDDGCPPGPCDCGVA